MPLQASRFIALLLSASAIATGCTVPVEETDRAASAATTGSDGVLYCSAPITLVALPSELLNAGYGPPRLGQMKFTFDTKNPSANRASFTKPSLTFEPAVVRFKEAPRHVVEFLKSWDGTIGSVETFLTHNLGGTVTVQYGDRAIELAPNYELGEFTLFDTMDEYSAPAEPMAFPRIPTVPTYTTDANGRQVQSNITVHSLFEYHRRELDAYRRDTSTERALLDENRYLACFLTESDVRRDPNHATPGFGSEYCVCIDARPARRVTCKTTK